MTDTITPEPTADDYRAAEKVLRAARFGGFRGGYDDEADWCKEEAARLEAESARDEEAERLAEVYRVAFKAAAGDSYIADGSWAVAGIRAVLDRLAADGRLLPEGGTVPKHEYCGRGLCAALEGHEGTCAEASGWAGVSGGFTPPAASVPDSGPWETLVEDALDVGMDVHDWEVVQSEGDAAEAAGEAIRAALDHLAPFVNPAVPDSGPDGTPEKPWETRCGGEK
ncbi:hypothetical protein [Prescottella equi]|uniref:hypothetical protein n=1 Tax=Rhodococcus hoagii TaxID=43767 RepID=UPI000A10F08C|nr:hypothetical protein [Prescottella equi]ORM21800.1 hypothetical protein A5N74_03070 [Prescottella equi]